MPELDPYTTIIAGFVTAVVAGIAIRMIIDHTLRPIITIDGNEAVIVRGFGLRVPIARGGNDVPFNANRIRVRNTGRSAARDCKVLITVRMM